MSWSVVAEAETAIATLTHTDRSSRCDDVVTHRTGSHHVICQATLNVIIRTALCAAPGKTPSSDVLRHSLCVPGARPVGSITRLNGLESTYDCLRKTFP